LQHEKGFRAFNSRLEDEGQMKMNKKLAVLAFGIVVLANPHLIQTNGRVTNEKPFQPWVKKGRIIAPGFAGPHSQSRVSALSVVRLRNGQLRMYFWATGRGHHYIYAAEASPKNPYDWKLVKKEPVLGPSLVGNINDKGASFPWVIQQDGRWLMYYVTWGSWAPPDELSNRTALASSDDEGMHWKVFKEPLLPLGKSGEYDAGVTGSVAVLRTGPQTYQMWYTAGERYAILEFAPGSSAASFTSATLSLGMVSSGSRVKSRPSHRGWTRSNRMKLSFQNQE
jgi:hypothetical protein